MKKKKVESTITWHIHSNKATNEYSETLALSGNAGGLSMLGPKRKGPLRIL